MAEHLGLSPDEFVRAYVRRVSARQSLKELPGGDCVLWGGPERGCLVYPVRPIQCQTFPFWSEHLGSPQAWARLAEHCPGANRGPRYSLREIETRRKKKF